MSEVQVLYRPQNLNRASGFLILCSGEQSKALCRGLESRSGYQQSFAGRETGSGKFLSDDEKIIPDRVLLIMK